MQATHPHGHTILFHIHYKEQVIMLNAKHLSVPSSIVYAETSQIPYVGLTASLNQPYLRQLAFMQSVVLLLWLISYHYKHLQYQYSYLATLILKINY